MAQSYLNDPSLILNAPYIQLPGNVMDGDGGAGLEISGSGTTGNVVDDNGMSQSGGDGVLIASGASGNWIGVNPVGGQLESAEQNTIVTNTAAGMELPAVVPRATSSRVILSLQRNRRRLDRSRSREQLDRRECGRRSGD